MCQSEAFSIIVNEFENENEIVKIEIWFVCPKFKKNHDFKIYWQYFKTNQSMKQKQTTIIIIC